MTLKTLTFAGTPGADLVTPSGYIAYASPFIYDAAGDSVRAASGEFCQLVDNQVCAGVSEATLYFNWIPGVNSAEWGICAIDPDQSGFSTLITNQYVDEVTGYIAIGKIRKELEGGGYAEIDTVSDLGIAEGVQKLRVRYTLPEGLAEAWLNDVPIMSATYLDFVENLNMGAQAYTGADGFSFASLTTEVNASGASIDVLNAILYPGVTAAYETTGVGLDDPIFSITLGGETVAFTQSEGDGTLTPPAWEDGVIQPLDHGTPHAVVISDGTLSATANRLYGVPAGLVHRTVPGSVSTSETSLYRNEVIAPGTDVYLPSSFNDHVAEDGELIDVSFGTYTGFWRRDLDYTMYSFDLVFSEEGATEIPTRILSGKLLRGKLL